MIHSENELANPTQSLTTTPLGHLGSPDENFLVNNCGMYDSF